MGRLSEEERFKLAITRDQVDTETCHRSFERAKEDERATSAANSGAQKSKAGKVSVSGSRGNEDVVDSDEERYRRKMKRKQEREHLELMMDEFAPKKVGRYDHLATTGHCFFLYLV